LLAIFGQIRNKEKASGREAFSLKGNAAGISE
jgi:hypothetical protein